MPKSLQKFAKTFLKVKAWRENRYIFQVVNANFCLGCSILNTNQGFLGKMVNNQSVELFKKALKN